MVSQSSENRVSVGQIAVISVLN
uniref:Uncharacterized protein n=1 Tax=Arundo donax TaxID=35708 RepID=A0A0A9CAX1_ARUDO